MESLINSWRPGLKAFFESAFLADYNLNQKISKIISIANIRDVEDNLPASFRLLTTPSLEEAKDIISKLKQKSEVRKEKIREIIGEIEDRISEKEELIIFEGDINWDFSLISSAASVLCRKSKKPTFLFKKMEKESQGTVRTPSDIDSVDLMKKCKEYLQHFYNESRKEMVKDVIFMIDLCPGYSQDELIEEVKKEFGI